MLCSDETPGWSKTLQAVRHMTNEEISQGAGRGKSARTQSTAELAEGGDAQKMDAHGSAWSHWAVLASDGTTKCSTASFASPMVASGPGVMPVHQYEGERL